MSLITKKPDTLKAENDLDKISQDELGRLPQMIRLSGRDLFVMEEPLEAGEYIRAEVIMKAGDLLVKAPDADGVSHHVRIMQYIGSKLTVAPYIPQPEPETEPMIDEEGRIVDDETSVDGGESGDLSGLDPAFSHGTTK